MMFLPKVACCSRLMPSPQVCAKCKQIPSAEGDSWCSGCSAWEFIGREISANWDLPGARLLASDILVSAARQVKALRSLSSGVAREPIAPVAAGGTRAASAVTEHRGDRRDTLPRRRSVPPPPPAKEEEFSDVPVEESDEEEETEQEPTPEVDRRESGGSRRPPEPDHPPRGREQRDQRAGESRAPRSERGSHHRGDEGRDRKRRRSSNRRGGRKHQRLGRLATDPFLRVHRKPPSSLWELQIPGKEHLESSHLGR